MDQKGQQLKLSKRYEPLFQWFSANETSPLFKVDTVIITGGRNSQKSFAVGAATCIAAKDYGRSVLYTRYTLTSAEDSIIPEFNEKIDILNCHNSFNVKRDRVESPKNTEEDDRGYKIVFKGIKTSSGNQTAALKSLKGFSVFVLEEGEEMPDFTQWDKIKKSIRAEKRNLNIIILNPTTREHWIYKEFFGERGVNEGWNGVKDNVLYIHSTYLDMEREHIADNIWEDFETARRCYEVIKNLSPDQLEKLQAVDPKTVKLGKYYKHSVLGGWLAKAEGVIITNWTIGEFKEVGKVVFGQDYGFSVDPTTLIKTSIDKAHKKIYVKELLYKPGLTTSDIARVNLRECGDALIYGDSAEPRLIAELKEKGCNVREAEKGQGSITAGIAMLQDFELIIDPESINLIKELNNYVWNDKKSGTPVDDYNHAIDALRYAIYSQLVNNFEWSF